MIAAIRSVFLAATLAIALYAVCMAALAVAQAPPGTYDPYAPLPPPGTGTPAPPGAKPPARDAKAPRLTKVTLKPKIALAKTGMRLTFNLDEAALVSGVVTLRRQGVRTRGRRCVRRTRGRRGPSCTMRNRAGTLLAARAAKGLNRARLSLRPLSPGLYTLTLTPKDAAGNVGASKAVAFQVVRPAKRAAKKVRRPARKT